MAETLPPCHENCPYRFGMGTQYRSEGQLQGALLSTAEETFPVIGKSELFTDSTGGNRLTKSNTVSFRGTQREILLEYGKSFKLEPFKSYFKMNYNFKMS